MNGLQPNDLTNDPLLFKEKRDTNDLQILNKENVVDKKDDMDKQPFSSVSDKENSIESPLGTKQKKDIEHSSCNNNTDKSPGDYLLLNYVDNSKNIEEDFHSNDSINPSLTKDIIDTNILKISLKKHLVNEKNDLNNTKTANAIEKDDKIVQENSLNGTNKENENITKLKTSNTPKEENYDMRLTIYSEM